MKCLDDHHVYELANFEKNENESSFQILSFIKKEPKEPDSTELKTVHNGTTNEEVLAMLIHRLNRLNNKFPCRENALAITHCEIALMFLEKRTKERVARGVEGKQIP